jgi:hypothetical protein
VGIYRLVFLDDEGRQQAYYSISCSTDVEAARQARATGYRHEIQIWDGNTIVLRMNCRDLQAAPPTDRLAGRSATL